MFYTSASAYTYTSAYKYAYASACAYACMGAYAYHVRVRFLFDLTRTRGSVKLIFGQEEDPKPGIFE